MHIAGAARPGGGLHIYSLEERSYEAVPDANQGRWLADGRTILFRSESKLMTVDLESREVNTAYEIPDGSPFSAWEIDQDNRWIYFMQSETEWDIWRLALDEPSPADSVTDGACTPGTETNGPPQVARNSPPRFNPAPAPHPRAPD